MAYTRNATPPHLVKRPCRKCKEPTLALNRKTGQLMDHPMCERCSKELAKEFDAARRQADAAFFKTHKHTGKQAVK